MIRDSSGRERGRKGYEVLHLGDLCGECGQSTVAALSAEVYQMPHEISRMPLAELTHSPTLLSIHSSVPTGLSFLSFRAWPKPQTSKLECREWAYCNGGAAGRLSLYFRGLGNLDSVFWSTGRRVAPKGRGSEGRELKGSMGLAEAAKGSRAGMMPLQIPRNKSRGLLKRSPSRSIHQVDASCQISVKPVCCVLFKGTMD